MASKNPDWSALRQERIADLENRSAVLVNLAQKSSILMFTLIVLISLASQAWDLSLISFLTLGIFFFLSLRYRRALVKKREPETWLRTTYLRNLHYISLLTITFGFIFFALAFSRYTFPDTANLFAVFILTVVLVSSAIGALMVIFSSRGQKLFSIEEWSSLNTRIANTFRLGVFLLLALSLFLALAYDQNYKVIAGTSLGITVSGLLAFSASAIITRDKFLFREIT